MKLALVVLCALAPNLASADIRMRLAEKIKSGEAGYIIGCVVTKNLIHKDVCPEIFPEKKAGVDPEKYRTGDVGRYYDSTGKLNTNDWSVGGPRARGDAPQTVALELPGGLPKVGSGTQLGALKSCHGKYLRVESPKKVYADRQRADICESFFIELLDDDVVALVTWQGLYLCGDDDGTLDADRANRGKYEKWKVIRRPNGKFAFQSAMGWYLCADDKGNVSADRKSIGHWEEFSIESPVASPRRVADAQIELWARLGYLEEEGSNDGNKPNNHGRAENGRDRR